MNSVQMLERRSLQIRTAGYLLRVLAVCLAILLTFAGQPAFTQPGQAPAKTDLNKFKMAGTEAKAAAKPGGAALLKDAPSASMYVKSFAGPGNEVQAKQAGGQANAYVVLLVEFDSQASRERFRVPGATVYSAFERFADMYLPADDSFEQVFRAVLNSPGLRWLDPPTLVEVPPTPSLKPGPVTRAVPEEIIRGGLAGMTGKGVIVAVIDSGIDFRNRDFVVNDAAGQPSSRLLYLWDTTSDTFDSARLGSKAPFSYPNGASVGTLYSKDQLTADLRSPTPRIPATDTNGHGTSAASIAAGNGKNLDGLYTGVAPDADIIGVRIGGATGSMQNAYLLTAAIAWVDSLAKRLNKPVVISCSFGGHFGGHDGTTVRERQIDARFQDSIVGRAIVIAAGNEQQDGLHARLTFKDKTAPALFVWEAGEKGAGLQFYIRGTGPGQFDPSGLRILPAQAEGIVPINLEKRVAFTHPLSGDFVLRLDVPQGVSGLYIWNEAGTPTQGDAYIINGKFAPQIQSADELVGTPGTSKGAITVASYDWNDQFNYKGQVRTLGDPCRNAPMTIGDLSCYSSPGYRRDGYIKPDITAPGEIHYGSYAHNSDGTGVNQGHALVDTSGKYELFNGTSAATPYTAGVIALIMQKNPQITLGDIRALLKRYATSDTYTGRVPNPRWGYGKLDKAAATSILNNIR